jgi:hypothetical protein
VKKIGISGSRGILGSRGRSCLRLGRLLHAYGRGGCPYSCLLFSFLEQLEESGASAVPESALVTLDDPSISPRSVSETWSNFRKELGNDRGIGKLGQREPAGV